MCYLMFTFVSYLVNNIFRSMILNFLYIVPIYMYRKKKSMYACVSIYSIEYGFKYFFIYVMYVGVGVGTHVQIIYMFMKILYLKGITTFWMLKYAHLVCFSCIPLIWLYKIWLKMVKIVVRNFIKNIYLHGIPDPNWKSVFRYWII